MFFMKKTILFLFSVLLFSSLVTGCASTKELENVNKQQADMIQRLLNEISLLNQEVDDVRKSEVDLQQVRDELEAKLKEQLSANDFSVKLGARGLVVTLLDQILFDSGKATLKSSALGSLNEVATVISELTPENRVFVEGHTDADPIRYSGFKSNFELSTARALEVVHYFLGSVKLNPKQFVVAGYGEFSPVVANDSRENKAKNRRVEILISPRTIDS